jgi:hypothetical protein
VDRIEIVLLKGVSVSDAQKYLSSPDLAPRMEVPDDLCEVLAELWQQLPKGEQARCHTPPYGLRFFRGKKLLCEASICWACNNIHGHRGNRPFFREFDAKDATSEKLFNLVDETWSKSAAAS